MKRVIDINGVRDIVTARQSGKDISRLLGFGLVDQTKLATAISEMTRNVIQYAGSGTCVITHQAQPDTHTVRVEVADTGPGIPNIPAVMVQGVSTGGGLGAGLPGTKRLVERFEISSEPGCTRVTLELSRPRSSSPDFRRPTAEPIAQGPVSTEELARQASPRERVEPAAHREVPAPSNAPSPAIEVSDVTEEPIEIHAAGLLSTVRVSNEFGVLQARQAARVIADNVGFSRVATCCIVTAVSELATNLVAHAVKGGMMTFTAVRIGEERLGIEIGCADEGPGMLDVARSLTSGFSTAGTLGGGLRAVTRMMDEVEIQSRDGRGSSIVARKWRSEG